jgi:hypothetical protein
MFGPSEVTSDVIEEAKNKVNDKYTRLTNNLRDKTLVFSESRVQRYVKRLNPGTSSGVDGITPEHLKSALSSNIALHLSVLFTLCLQFGLVPDSFLTGLLVPIVKKPNINPTIANNYRPITVSVTLSKLLEYYVLDECSKHSFSEYQFGFVPHRNTSMAASVANDVSELFNSQGSTVFLCSLDAEGAFDALPHSVLFDCVSKVLPDHCWAMLYHWYSYMHVHVKWNNELGPRIDVQRGTRQGGLTSPLIFNVFYQELVEILKSCKTGIIIDGVTYNVFCYADDLLLASATATGLQNLIDIAVTHITKRGLRFNPQKTTCVIYGKDYFKRKPMWDIDGCPLAIKEQVKYLGTILGRKSGHSHVDMRVSASNRAYYSLQNAGLCQSGLSPHTAIHIYTTAVRSGLQYGCASIHLTKSDLATLDKTQGKHVKSILGLDYSCHTTPILQALNVQAVSKSVSVSCIDLLKSCMLSDSAAGKLYIYLMKCDSNFLTKTLIGRSLKLCNEMGITFPKYVIDESYATMSKRCINSNVPSGANGVVDSIRNLLTNYDVNSRLCLRYMLKTF